MDLLIVNRLLKKAIAPQIVIPSSFRHLMNSTRLESLNSQPLILKYAESSSGQDNMT